MAADRFVEWEAGKRPSKEVVGECLRKFLGGAAVAVNWEEDRFFAVLHPGHQDEDRWIEVWLGENCVDVLTRQQDAFTCYVAQGFAKHVAGQFGGELQPD